MLPIAFAEIAPAGHHLIVYQKLDHLTSIPALIAFVFPRVFRLVSGGAIYGIPAVSATALQKMRIESRWGKVTFIHVYPVVTLHSALEIFNPLLNEEERPNSIIFIQQQGLPTTFLPAGRGLSFRLSILSFQAVSAISP